MLDNKTKYLPKFISIKNFTRRSFKFSYKDRNNKNRKQKRRIELTIGDIACFVKAHPDFVCDSIVRGILSKRHNGLESSTLYILVTYNKLDFKHDILQIQDEFLLTLCNLFVMQ